MGRTSITTKQGFCCYLGHSSSTLIHQTMHIRIVTWFSSPGEGIEKPDHLNFLCLQIFAHTNYPESEIERKKKCKWYKHHLCIRWWQLNHNLLQIILLRISWHSLPEGLLEIHRSPTKRPIGVWVEPHINTNKVKQLPALWQPANLLAFLELAQAHRTHAVLITTREQDPLFRNCVHWNQLNERVV